MEASEQIKKWQEFLERFYQTQIFEASTKGKSSIQLDFSEVARFSPELAEDLLEQPEDAIKSCEIALSQFETIEKSKKLAIRFFNLPAAQLMLIRNIRSEHLGKFLKIEGVVRQKGDVRPQITSAKFECPSCGNIITVIQTGQVFREPTRCSCGRQGNFRLVSKELIDAQGLVLEEIPEQLEGGEQPKRMKVLLKDDLVSPITEKKTNPGSKIEILGWVKEIPRVLNSGKKSLDYDLVVDANNIFSKESSFYEMSITKEQENEIVNLSKDPKIYEKLIASVAPSIFGFEEIKEALLLQLCGGVQKVRKDGIISRGDIHVLLVGDPGSGKSQMLKRISIVAPRGRYISGKGVSGAGLTAAVVKDEFLGGYSLEAGALVLANKGICCTTGDACFITEDFRKMSFEELFKNKPDVVYPDFKVLGLDLKTNKIMPFHIKKGFRIKNDKKIYHIKTRTGREIKLTEDNQVLVSRKISNEWIEVKELINGDYIAVPKKYRYDKKDGLPSSFAYLCGFIATDGHVKLSRKNAQTSIYNCNTSLIDVAEKIFRELGIKFNKIKTNKGRKSIIRGKEVISKQDLYKIYNCEKAFARRVIEFGIPAGNKSIKNCLNSKILGYSDVVLSNFMRGIFDGDGNIRKNPYEITLTTGIKDNAILYQEILLRLGIISSIKKSTNSWHCDVRGANECKKFLNFVGSYHPEKKERLINIKIVEQKNRIDIIPNKSDLFKKITSEKYWKLGKGVYGYVWNYSKKGVCPSKNKIAQLNEHIQDEVLARLVEEDILWDRVESIKEVNEEYVYDFTMSGANNFIANDIIMHNCIDELDKMTNEDRSAMHEALEQQTVSISKANIQATLIAQTTVLAAANPKLGRFDLYETMLVKQIDLPPTLINRFDLIFPIKDIPDRKKDEKMAKHILGLHQNPNMMMEEIPTKLFRKYIAYVKQKFNPELTDSALDEIESYYVELRSTAITFEEAARTIPISPRQLEAIVRLAEASAKVRLSDKVTREDARRAIELLNYSLGQIARDRETGKIDIDVISTGISSTERDKIIRVKEIVTLLETKFQSTGKNIPVEEIMAVAEEQGIRRPETEEIIQKLKRSGDLFEPRHGFIQKL